MEVGERLTLAYRLVYPSLPLRYMICLITRTKITRFRTGMDTTAVQDNLLLVDAHRDCEVSSEPTNPLKVVVIVLSKHASPSNALSLLTVYNKTWREALIYRT